MNNPPLLIRLKQEVEERKFKPPGHLHGLIIKSILKKNSSKTSVHFPWERSRGWPGGGGPTADRLKEGSHERARSQHSFWEEGSGDGKSRSHFVAV